MKTKFENVAYCVCQSVGKDGSKRHTKQSNRRFAPVASTTENYVIQPCTNHADNYAKGKWNWREVTPAKRSRLAIAKDFQRQIAKLQREREKLYAKALRELDMVDRSLTWDWFFNDQSGHGEFVGVLGK